MDDFFRAPVNQVSAGSDNRRFLHRSFRPSAQRLNLACRELAPLSEGGDIDTAVLMRMLSLPTGPAGWAQASRAKLEGVAGSGALPELGSDTLVIGWGLPPSILNWIDASGAAFLDVEVDPLRFAEHLSLCVRSNDPGIVQAARACRRHDETLWNEATVIQAYFARHGSTHLFDRNLRLGLFCGQTGVDLALVRDGRMAQPDDFIDQVGALARTVDLLLIKPHPYERNLEHLARLAQAIPNAVWTDQNIYALLCAENLEFVCAISSGALREAAYFLKPSIALCEPDRNRRELLPAACSPWTAVSADILSAEFFAQCCGVAPPAAGHRRSAFAADALDRIFGTRWGLDGKDPGLPALPTMRPGIRYAMNQGRAESAWLHFGWQTPGANGTHSLRSHAGAVIPVGRNASPADAGPRVLRIRARLAAGCRLRAWVTGQPGGQRSFDAGTMSALLHFDLPAHILDQGGAGLLIAQFEIVGNATSLCIEELSLLPAASPPPKAPGRCRYLLARTLRAFERRLRSLLKG